MTISAMVIEAFGDANVFKKQSIQKPLANPGQLLIEVKASSINPLDIKIRSNQLGQFCPPFPAVLHGDVAGIVSAVGADVKGFKVGDEVYGCAGGVGQLQGALTQLMSVDAHLMAHKPKNLSMTEAAAMPLVSLTAWLALKDMAHLAAHQTILIYGATGGVGHLAVQLAKAIGAEVTTTVGSDEKKALAKKMGADHIVNHQHTSIPDMVQQFTNGLGYDVVFDTVGNEYLDQAFQAARIGGHVVSILARGTHDLSPLSGKTLSAVMQPLPLITGVGRQHYGEILTEIAALVEAGKIKPLINQQQFKFSEVAAAHHYFEQGRAIGKVVLENDL